ncbi:hypothetical protein AURDEDRAFT_165316 [Auricularia subglabra TFB-10046 SS5]|nr:hypothetical protein AURDEDRAFT_165316 [Auricularia subglabra TFB-10046 SS5]
MFEFKLSNILPIFKAKKSLAGTVPQHSSYLLLHHPLRPTLYPSKLNTISPLLSAVQLRSLKSHWGLSANVAYLGDGTSSSALNDLDDVQIDPQTTAEATLFQFDRRMGFKLRQRLDVGSDVWKDGAPADSLADALSLLDAHEDSTPHLLVCTHAQRDCRCGDTGGAVVAELRRKAASLPVKIGELGHVGGHKYAANVLVFPTGDWFGDIEPKHVDLLLRYVDEGMSMPPPELVPHWRGGRGLSKEEQLDLADKWLNSTAPEGTL